MIVPRFFECRCGVQPAATAADGSMSAGAKGWASRLTVPVVEAFLPPINCLERRSRLKTAFSQILARVGVFADFRGFHGADGEVLEGRVGRVDDLVRIFRAGRYEDDIAGLQGKHLIRDPERALALKDEEHLFLSVMQVVGTPALARRKNVEGCAELLRGCTSRQTRPLSIVERLSQQACQRNLIDVANESRGKVRYAM